MANNSDDKKALVSVQGSQATIHSGEVDLNNLIIIEEQENQGYFEYTSDDGKTQERECDR